jgi:hypothetical protein
VLNVLNERILRDPEKLTAGSDRAEAAAAEFASK